MSMISIVTFCQYREYNVHLNTKMTNPSDIQKLVDLFNPKVNDSDVEEDPEESLQSPLKKSKFVTSVGMEFYYGCPSELIYGLPRYNYSAVQLLMFIINSSYRYIYYDRGYDRYTQEYER